jgi:hypothetical protein
MAKTYTLNERASGYSNPVAVAVPTTADGTGGLLAIGTTFYYKVIANGYANFYWDLNAWLSAPTSEVSATTDASNRVIWVHFDNDVSGAEETTTIRTEISGDYNQTDGSGNTVGHFPLMKGYRSNRYYGVTNIASLSRYTMTTSAMSLTPGETLTGVSSGATARVVSDPSGGTTFKVWTITGTFTGSETLNGSVSGASVGTFTSLSAVDGFVMEDYVSSAGGVLPVYAIGAPCMVLAGGTELDPITPQDIYDNLISVGKSQYLEGIPLFPDGDYVNSSGNDICNVFRFKMSLVDGTTTNWFKIPGGVVCTWALCKMIFRGNMIAGEIDAYGNTQNGAGIFGAWHLAFYNGMTYTQAAAEFKCYGSLIGSKLALPGTSCNRDPYYQASGIATVHDSIFQSSGRFNVYGEKKNSRMMLSGEAAAQDNTSNVENTSFNTHQTNFYAIAEATFNNYILKRYSSYNTFLDGFYTERSTKMLHFNDPVWSPDTTYMARTRGDASGVDLVLHESFTVNMKVIDSDGNPIENARVTIENVDGENALFNKTWNARTYTALEKAGTAMTLWAPGSIDVGKYYRVADEIIYIVSGSYPNYTIARAQKGSTANSIGGGASNKTTYLYEQYDYLDTDASGDITTFLNSRYWKVHDYTSTGTTYITDGDMITRNPFDIKIVADGYETYTMKYTATVKKDMVIELKKSIPVMVGGDKVVVKIDPRNSGVNRDKIV